MPNAITVGASSGIGWALARELSGEYDLGLAARRTEAEMDIEFVLPDGNAVTNVALAPVPGEDGPSGVVAVARDVTDRVQRERELERYETIVESTLDLIYVVDPDGRFVRVNDAMVKASGYDREKLLGSHASLVANEGTVDHMESLIRELLREGREQTFTEASIVFADGTRREYVCSLSMLRDDDGEFQGTVIVAHDVTDLRDHRRRLSVLDRVLRRNLRNRMNVILGYAGELTDHSDPAVAEFGAEIEDSAADLLELSESARRFESVISGETEATRSVDVVGLLEATAESGRAEHPGVTVSLDAPEAAPVRAHETFELALEELLENAVRHDDRAGLSVEVSVSVGDDDVEIRVADDGPTLPEVYRRALSAGTESPLEHTQGPGPVAGPLDRREPRRGVPGRGPRPAGHRRHPLAAAGRRVARGAAVSGGRTPGTRTTATAGGRPTGRRRRSRRDPSRPWDGR